MGQVLTIPPRSSARVFANRCVPTPPLCSSRFDKKAPTEVRAAWRRTSGSGKDRTRQGRARQTPVSLSTDVFRWVRPHKLPGVTRHSIHGSDVCASRPRATAAMRRGSHGATGGATARGEICGTSALTASERAQPTGAGRCAGANARKPQARDGVSSVRAWLTFLTTKCRHHGASICGHSSARRPRSTGSC